MKVGICGLGFVGNAIRSFMLKDPHVQTVIVYDKYKHINVLDDLLRADFIFICIPTPYDERMKQYDMDELDTTLFLLAEMKYKGIILIKSTVLPDYGQVTNNRYPKLNILHNPEFLSAATANYDFEHQEHIILGYTDQSERMITTVEKFYKTLFPKALISTTDATTSAMTKLALNSFYATKVQFFSEIFLLCEKTNINYNEVKNLMLNNKWINPKHTQVPGHDGHISYGGMCLPKDINALHQYMCANDTPHQVLDAVIAERNLMRL